MPRTYLIAEAGVNHNGSIELAERLVKAAAQAGADAVKFQAFSASELVTSSAERAEYQRRNTESSASQRDMLASLELDEGAHRHLLDCARGSGIDFLSSAFDEPSIRMLARLALPVWKVPSGELTNLPYLRLVAECAVNARVLLSTGMADLEEVAWAIGVLGESGVSRDRLTVLHCSSEYPAPPEDVNLRAMLTLAGQFGVRVGYSDHTEGWAIPVAAVALGASVIEKHLTLDRGLPGPDHAASLEPNEFAQMTLAIRTVEDAMGDGVKRPSEAELATRAIVRKSIVAKRPIRAGEAYSADNLTTKRPEGGISARRWDEVLGASAPRDFEADEAIDL